MSVIPVKVGQVVYLSNKVPRCCRRCLHVFAGKLNDKHCSDVCKERSTAERKPRKVRVAKVAKPPEEPDAAGPRVFVTHKLCPQCGNPFVAARVSQICCDNDCAKAYRVANKRVIKNCLQCGAEFSVPRSKQHKERHCSKACREAYREDSKIEIACPVCERKFTIYKKQLGSRKTCSHGCANILTARRKQNAKNRICGGVSI